MSSVIISVVSVVLFLGRAVVLLILQIHSFMLIMLLGCRMMQEVVFGEFPMVMAQRIKAVQ